jgi:hypothetical protein
MPLMGVQASWLIHIGETIRSLAGEYQLTLKRVREVREHGVHGFLASEWHFLITGKWLDGSTST